MKDMHRLSRSQEFIELVTRIVASRNPKFYGGRPVMYGENVVGLCTSVAIVSEMVQVIRVRSI